MAKIEMNDSAKAAILNAVLEAELDLIEAIRQNALREEKECRTLKAKHVLRETHYRDIYAALYSLCDRLGLRDFYDEWREEPTYEAEESEVSDK